jgi:hypothetical protein
MAVQLATSTYRDAKSCLLSHDLKGLEGCGWTALTVASLALPEIDLARGGELARGGRLVRSGEEAGIGQAADDVGKAAEGISARQQASRDLLTERRAVAKARINSETTARGAAAREQAPARVTASSSPQTAAEAGGGAATTVGPKAITAGGRVPNQLAPIRSFVTQEDRAYYRVFSGERNVGGFLMGAPPASADEAVAGLALPPENTADFLQEVLVPAGTRLQSSIAAPAFGQPGGLLQFELLEDIPIKNFGPGMEFR